MWLKGREPPLTQPAGAMIPEIGHSWKCRVCFSETDWVFLGMIQTILAGSSSVSLKRRHTNSSAVWEKKTLIVLRHGTNLFVESLLLFVEDEIWFMKLVYWLNKRESYCVLGALKISSCSLYFRHICLCEKCGFESSKLPIGQSVTTLLQSQLWQCLAKNVGQGRTVKQSYRVKSTR